MRSPQEITRRKFLGTSAIFASSLALAGCAGKPSAASSHAPRRISPNEKLNIGIIGAGGKGSENIAGVSSENIIAICDVDQKRGGAGFEKFPQATAYQDFRIMLEKEKSLDAVVVTTPDHTHAHASLMAMRLGKHVYCEKPLTHSIYEARLMRETAARYKVATQMGNQGHSYDSTRRVVELVRGGVIGNVHEVHVWTDRPIWPQGMERPRDSEPVPPHLNWDLWLGPAPFRPYHSSYLPFNWRGWWDFGTGALGDMACHCADTAFWALDPGPPLSIEAESSGMNKETAPKWSIIRYEFGPRSGKPGFKLTWYDGGKLPTVSAWKKELPKNGSFIVGDKGTIFLRDWNANNFLILPEEKFARLEGPAPSLPRAQSHYKEWIEACKGGPAALSNFDYASRLTETVLLGNVAVRVGKKIEWDEKALRARNCPEADQFIKKEYRKGWELG